MWGTSCCLKLVQLLLVIKTNVSGAEIGLSFHYNWSNVWLLFSES